MIFSLSLYGETRVDNYFHTYVCFSQHRHWSVWAGSFNRNGFITLLLVVFMFRKIKIKHELKHERRIVSNQILKDLGYGCFYNTLTLKSLHPKIKNIHIDMSQSLALGHHFISVIILDFVLMLLWMMINIQNITLWHVSRIFFRNF